MSILHLAAELEPLAGRLARALHDETRRGDFFLPARVVIPHRFLGQWLKLWLARQHQVAINLRFQYLEQLLWDLLRAIDPRPHAVAPEFLDEESYRLLVLAVLLEKKDPALDFWFPPSAELPDSPRGGPRLWHLASLLSQLIRDYEYHRQESLIQHWLRNELVLKDMAELERAQRAIFQGITRLPDGKRALLNEHTGRNFKTLPQYAMEVWEQFFLSPGLPGPDMKALFAREPQLGVPIHVFGLTQASGLHLRTLSWLGNFFDLRVYHLNALVGRLPASPTRAGLKKLTHRIFQGEEAEPLPLGDELLRAWDRAGAESLAAFSEHLLGPGKFQVDRLATRPREVPAGMLDPAPLRNSVLARLQDHLVLGRGEREPARLRQDCSLQIVGCPGLVREVETVYQNILFNLERDPSLRQTDIAVLTTDLNLYRPVLQGVFERLPRRLHYHLAEFSAAGVSLFGQALVDLLDLGLEAFTRSRVFRVLLNPCFLAGLKVDREQAQAWLEWAEALGIYQGWDQGDKKERGYPDSPLFAWRLGLQRLRLGRIMDRGSEGTSESALRFGQVIPYADFASSDPEALSVFCLAVEGLLPRLMELRNLKASGATWALKFHQLADDFLGVPPDRPEEGPVRSRWLGALERLSLLDQLGQAPPSLNLSLVREMVHDQLERIEGSHGVPLTGITLGGLAPLRPLPFRLVYVLGLGEAGFPGSNQLSPADLRGAQNALGDIRPAEFNRYLLLETLLAARDRVYLFYQEKDLQRDQPLYPCAMLRQLKRYLEDHILEAPFQETQVPIQPHADCYLDPVSEEACSDVLVQFNPSDRMLAVLEGSRRGERNWTPEQVREIERRRALFFRNFQCAGENRASRRVPAISTRDLRYFLANPAQAALKRHLNLKDEDEEEAADDEPFVTPKWPGNQILEQALHQIFHHALEAGPAEALKAGPDHLRRVYHHCQLQCMVPEGGFGQIDLALLQEELRGRLHGAGGLEAFLHGLAGKEVCGPLLLGTSREPLGARRRFPALEIPLTRPLPAYPLGRASIHGSHRLAWLSGQALELLVITFKDENSKAISKSCLESALLYFALKAGPGNDWLGGRPLHLHLAQPGGLKTLKFSEDRVTSQQAHDYLSHLATDFLDPACFDHLPLDGINNLMANFPLQNEPPDRASADRYREALAEWLEDQADNPFARRSPLLEMIEPAIPADALEKVYRRFYLIQPPA